MKKNLVTIASLVFVGAMLSSCGAKDPEAILGDIAYEEYVVNDNIVVSVPEVLEVENWAGYLKLTKKDCFEMSIGKTSFSDHTTEATWESVKTFYKGFYSTTKDYTVAGIEGIMTDKGAGIGMLFPLDDENMLYIDLPGLGEDAKKRKEIFESPEVQVVLKKLKIKQ